MKPYRNLCLKVIQIASLTFVIMSAVTVYPSGADDLAWFEVKGSARVIDGDNGKARQLATERAQEAAVRMALADVGLETMRANFMLGGGAVSSIPFLSIDGVERLQEMVREQKQGGEDPVVETYLTVKMRLAVRGRVWEPKSDFRITASLNRAVFSEGDEMQLRIRSNYDCVYSIYLVTSDEGVSRLVPSRLKTDNRLVAGRPLLFPSEAESARGIRLRAHLPENQRSTTETFFIVAFRGSNVDMDDKQMQEAIFGLYGDQAIPLKSLVRNLADVPLERRAEYFLTYGIRPKS